ncbi:MAG: DsbA family protein [Deltaproteobacteria bacterium]|jgi:protein-disulfide isomerase|nr:DsbA family protein [Deltaproteobacteria bacterium]
MTHLAFATHITRGRRPTSLPHRPTHASLSLLLFAFALLGCGPLAPRGESETTTTESTGEDPVALVIEGKAIHVSAVDAYMQEVFLEELMSQPEDQIFEACERAVRNLIQKHVIETEANARGTTADALFAEITATATPPSDDAVAAWYAENASRLRGASFEEVESSIRELLAQEAQRETWMAFIGPKIETLSYDIKLAPPRKQLEPTHLVRGPAEAPVTVMVFSDYQCPYCIRSEPVLAELRARYPVQVRVIHRHFPLDSIHPQARPAAEAAMCADEQGRFWDYHDAIFARRGRLAEDSFVEIAGELELDLDAFGACREEGRHAAFVQADLEAGRAAGVTGTPAFFINGIPMKGARDADQLAAVVDAELTRLAGAPETAAD